MEKLFEWYELNLNGQKLFFAFTGRLEEVKDSMVCEIISEVEVFDEEDNTWHVVPDVIARIVEDSLYSDLFYRNQL